MMNAKARPESAAVVIGVGAETGLGAALARRFAHAGMRVTIAGRTPERLKVVADQIAATGGTVSVKVADAAKEADVLALFDDADKDCTVELVAYNVGSNVAASALETTPELFERLWRQNAFGGFVVGREAARRMTPRGKGTILFTGATASLRARPPFLAFGAAKAGLRSVAQGLAREFSPQGIHVAHVVIDGGIDTEFVRGLRPDFEEAKAHDLVLSPDAIAAQYVMLHKQHRSAWTHELDLRPWGEKF